MTRHRAAETDILTRASLDERARFFTEVDQRQHPLASFSSHDSSNRNEFPWPLTFGVDQRRLYAIFPISLSGLDLVLGNLILPLDSALSLRFRIVDKTPRFVACT